MQQQHPSQDVAVPIVSVMPLIRRKFRSVRSNTGQPLPWFIRGQIFRNGKENLLHYSNHLGYFDISEIVLYRIYSCFLLLSSCGKMTKRLFGSIYNEKIFHDPAKVHSTEKYVGFFHICSTPRNYVPCLKEPFIWQF